MSMLPPAPAVTPPSPVPSTNTSNSSTSNNGKEFANTLERAQSQTGNADKAKPNSTNNASRTDSKGAGTQKQSGDAAKAGDKATTDTKTTDTPVGDGTSVVAPTPVVVPDVTASVLPEGTPVAEVAAESTEVLAANLQANTEVAAAASAAVGTAEDGVQTVPNTTTPVDASKTVDPAGLKPAAGATTGQPVTQNTVASPVPQAADGSAGVPVENLATVETEIGDAKSTDAQATNTKAATDPAVRPATEAIVNNLHKAAEVAAPKVVQTQQQMPEPIRQVVQLVHPLRHQGDGDYKLTLQLYPEHLGRVEVAVSLNQGQISMQLTADNQQSRQMLRDAMNELRQALQDSGLSTGSLDVSDHQFGSDRSQKETTQSGHVSGDSVDMDEDTFLAGVAERVNRNQAATDGAVDVRV